MPAEPTNVNLLGHDAIEESPIGRLVIWATTYGRYIMVLTEVVVLLAFLSRFTLDRKLTDLNEAIDQKKAIIEANLPFEEEINLVHQQIAEVKNIISRQDSENELLATIKKIIPPDVYLKSLEINTDSITIDAVAGSTTGFAQFITNFQNYDKLRDISLSELRKDPREGIVFSMAVKTASPQPQPATIKEETNQKAKEQR